jgi:nicotinate phosphoribosyltransferase
LVPVFRAGRCVYQAPPLEAVRETARSNLAGFYAGIRRFVNPHLYFVGIESSLHEEKTRLILQARQG